MDAVEAAVDAHEPHSHAPSAPVQLDSAAVAASPSPAESIRVQPRAVLDDIYNAVGGDPLPASCNHASPAL